MASIGYQSIPIGSGAVQKIASWGVPSGIAPSGTMGANGSVDFGANTLPYAFGATSKSFGLWLAFAAGAVYSGSPAASFWVVMQSTSTGTVYQNQLGSDFPFIPQSSSLVPITASGPGAFTGLTTETLLATVSIPGGTLGTGGSIDIFASYLVTPSGNFKTGRSRYAGFQISSAQQNTGTVNSVGFQWILSSAGQPNSQWGMNGSLGGVAGSTSLLAPNLGIDSTVAQPLTIHATTAVATDYSILIFGRIASFS